MTRDTLMAKLNDSAPAAVCLIEKSEERLPQFLKPDKVVLPKNPSQLAKTVSCSEELVAAVNCLSPETIDLIQSATKGQSENQLWLDQRKGRITASMFHRVMTGMYTYSHDPSVSMDNLLKKLCGYSDTPMDIPALKYGRNMEAEAIEKYKALHMSTCGKCGCSVKQCGIFIDKNDKFIGASPDGIIACHHHGSGLLEVKCPLTSANTRPSVQTVRYLKTGQLNRQHMYYTQIQGQLAVAEKDWCDFFVYSRHGWYCERIRADKIFWARCKEQLVRFFKLFLAPELIRQDVLNVVTEEARVTDQLSYLFDQNLNVGCEIEVVSSSSEVSVLGECSQTSKKSRRKVKGKRKREAHPIYLCVVCELPCKDISEITDVMANSIECSNCALWCHWKCTEMSENDIENMSSCENWFCANCVAE